MINEYKLDSKDLTIQNISNLNLLFQAKRGFQISYNRQKISIIVGGIATTLKKAIKKANSEFIERICAIYQNEKLVSSTKKIPNYKKYEAIFPDTYHYWVVAQTFNGKSKIFLPAHIIFVKFLGKESKKLPPIDGSGLASRKSLTTAKLHGLLEVIERDQICLFWDVTKAKSSLVIHWEQYISSKIIKFIKKLSYQPLVLYLNEFRNEGVHTFIVVLENANGCITVGTASSVDVKTGLEKAILEAIVLQGTVKLSDKKKSTVNKTSISHVLYAYQNSNSIRNYINAKIKNKIPFSDIQIERDKKIDYKNLEKKFNAQFYFYKFPRSMNNQIVVRVIIPTAYRKSNAWPINKLQKSNRLNYYMRKFKSPINKTIPHPYG